MTPQTYDEWLTNLRGADDATIAVHRDRIAGGYPNAMAAEQVYREREAAKAEIKHEHEAEHTFCSYWCLADWGERFGMVSFLTAVFLLGFGCAKTEAIRRFIDCMLSIKQ